MFLKWSQCACGNKKPRKKVPEGKEAAKRTRGCRVFSHRVQKDHFAHSSALLNQLHPYHPSTPDFCSSEIPKDKEPMKSFLLVRSQSQISTDNLLSLSASFSWLEGRKEKGCLVLEATATPPHPSNDISTWVQNEGMASITRQPFNIDFLTAVASNGEREAPSQNTWLWSGDRAEI